ncbi:MAG: radical SAM protein [bacterium]
MRKTTFFVFKRHAVSILKRLNFTRILNIFVLIIETKLRKVKVKHYPIVARINTIPYCNLLCPGCKGEKYKDVKESTHIIKFEEYKKIIDKISKHLMLAILYDEGEPLLNNDIYKIISYTNSLNISTTISTNLSFKMTEKNIDNLILSGLDRLIVSLDGMTQEIYARYRVNGDVELVKDNLKKIIEAKKKHNKKYPVIDVQFLNFGYNEHEMHDAEKFSYSVGADTFSSYDANFHGCYPFDGSESERVKLGCSCIWTALHINNDCMVYPCNYGEDNGFEPIASIYENDFNAFWNGEFIQKLRKGFNKKNKKLEYWQCKQCPNSEALPRILQ